MLQKPAFKPSFTTPRYGLTMETVRIGLPAETLKAVEQIALIEDISVGQVVRDAIERDLFRRQRARKPVRADERLVAPLRALLADDFAYARDWNDLARRLAVKGYMVLPAGGGIALHEISGRRLCKGSELGYSYATLLRRFKHPLAQVKSHRRLRKIA